MKRTMSDMVNELCTMDIPEDAKTIVNEMENYHGGSISRLKEDILDAAKIESEKINGTNMISIDNLEAILLRF